MAGSISPGKIEAAQFRIYDVLAQTSDPGSLTEEEQDKLLADACADACEILSDWVDSPQWNALAPSEPFARQPVATAIEGWQHIKPFLEPVRDALSRARAYRNVSGAAEIGDPSAYIDTMIRAAEYTARRHRRFDRTQLYEDATEKTRDLSRQVCEMATELRADLAEIRRLADAAARESAADLESKKKRAQRRKRAFGLLKAVSGLLLTVGLAMAGAGPSAVHQNMPEWGHEVVNVLFVHQVAHTAAPTVQIAPPRLGPHVR